VAHNLWVSFCRWRVLDGARLRFLVSSEVQAPMRDEAPDVARHLEDTLCKLAPHYRAALVLVGIDGLSQDEATGVFGTTPQALRQRLTRGRRLLRAALPKELIEPLQPEKDRP